MLSFKTLYPAEFIRFCIIGVICTIANYAIFYTLYSMLNFPYLTASAIGFIAGVFIGYPLNRRWTYKVKLSSRLQIFSYLLVYISSLILSIAFLRLLVEYGGLDPKVANILIIGLTTCTNYLGVKLLVFNTRAKNSTL